MVLFMYENVSDAKTFSEIEHLYLTNVLITNLSENAE